MEYRLLETQVLKSVRLPYLLWLPGGLTDESQQPWPLLLYLHGWGERGADLDMLKRNGIPRALEDGKSLPMIVVAPQCPPDSDWAFELDGLVALLDYTLQSYPADPSRVYLTGLSMGGRGSWLLAAAHPKRFAALVPICGRRPSLLRHPEEVVVLKNIPTWVFHGEKDDIVPVEESRLLVHALRACGGSPHLTIYPDATHDSWTQAYADPALYQWMLAQKKEPV